MSEPLFSPSWYRVAQLQPRLRKHAEIHRHQYRGDVWYLLQNHASGQFFRFTPVLYHVVGLMDGRLTVQELWENTVERYGDEAPTQGDMVRLLSQLHKADLLSCDIPPDTRELFQRGEKARQGKIRSYLFSPLSWRFPLFDPERFLNWGAPAATRLFSIAGLLVWLGVVIAALLMAGRHWSELSSNVLDRVFSSNNLLVLYLTYPLVKITHELGHAFAVKKWSGEVHEMGIMLLVLMPVPYVDASASTAFVDKRQRMLVGAAGILAELFLAAVALLLWVATEPGFVRSAAYNVVLIGSVSTLLFNGNPLLRYDGYYIFADLLEIPNLAQKSNEYLAALAKQRLFGMDKVDIPYAGQGSRFWLFCYGIAAFVYRLFVYVGIALFISGKFFIVGILLGIWACFSMIILPAAKGARFVLTSPLLRERRFRAVTVTAVIIAGVTALLFLLPVPSWTRAEGIVWAPEEAMVRAGENGFIRKVLPPPDTAVKKGDLLVVCEDPQLTADVELMQAQLALLEARYYGEILTDRSKAKITMEEMAPIMANLERAGQRLKDLEVRSPRNGRFVVPKAQDLPGRFIKQGELLGFVVQNERPVVRVVVSQGDIDLIRLRNHGAQVRFPGMLEQVITARVAREVPGAHERLPSNVLGSGGGGKVVTDPMDREGVKTYQKMFQVDIELPAAVSNASVGGRVYVRFDHGSETLATQWYRTLRRLFMRQFNV